MNKICFFNSTKAWGGGEKWHFDVAKELHEQGYDILFIAGKGSELSKRLKKTSIPYYTFKIGNLSFLNFILLNRLKRFFKKVGVHTLIMNLPIDVKVAGIAAKKAGVPRVIYRRGSAIPIKDKALNRYLFGKVITEIIANSEATKETILENNSNLFPREKIRVIYNGIDLQKREVKEYKPIYVREGDEIILGNAGRMVYQKGHEYLIQTALRLKEKGVRFKLLLAGSGPREGVIKSEVEKNGLTNEIVFLGFVEDISRFMRSIDIFLLSSRWEGFGFVLAEAMLEAKPIVAFNLSSNPELVVDQYNGFLIDPFNIKEFAKGTMELIQSGDLRKKMGEKGKSLVYEKFTFERTIAEVKDLLSIDQG